MKHLIYAVAAATLMVAPVHAASHKAMDHSKMNHNKMDHSKMDHSKMDHSKMDHSKMDKPMQSQLAMPTEPGQGAFAAIAEIVQLLSDDPNTDWSKVNIARLREHLVDMEEVTLRAKATTQTTDSGIIFNITGTGRTLQAIQAMVPAHSMVLNSTTGWTVEGKANEQGATMTITTDDPKAIEKIKALSFFGVMAIGAHHQAHHFAMAKGEMHVHAAHTKN